MRPTDLTLLQQMKITPEDIRRRLGYLDLGPEDMALLQAAKPAIAKHLDGIIDRFYDHITAHDEMGQLIGDAETLARLRNYQRSYILSLFDGIYDSDYVHSRLRVGLVHKRIGVEPTYYLAAMHTLTETLQQVLVQHYQPTCDTCAATLTALNKVLMFDLALVFDTYIHTLLQEVERNQLKLEQYAQSLEEQVLQRTQQLQEQAQQDSLTGLLNQRSFYERLRRELARAQRRSNETTLLYFDLDGFKAINDHEGHRRGDEILQGVAQVLLQVLRQTDSAARYGGDEFCAILPECSLDQAEEIAHRLTEAIAAELGDAGLSVSIGLAQSTPDYYRDAQQLVEAADAAMYRAKTTSGHSICRSEATPSGARVLPHRRRQGQPPE